jgi:hypothetical protein
MKLDDIRSRRDARQFQPFTLALKDGREFLIEAHYYLGFTSKGVVLAVTRERGTAWFAPEQVQGARLAGVVAT